MNAPPLAKFPCVSIRVMVKTDEGEFEGWYGVLSKTWWRENGGVGVEVKKPVLGWRRIEKTKTKK